MSSDRERRLKATGRWFQKPKKIKYLWTNNIFPLLLVAAYFYYIIIRRTKMENLWDKDEKNVPKVI